MMNRKKRCCKKRRIKRQKGGSAQWTYPTAKHGWRGWGSYWHPDPNAQRGGTAFPIRENNYRVGGNNWFIKYRK